MCYAHVPTLHKNYKHYLHEQKKERHLGKDAQGRERDLEKGGEERQGIEKDGKAIRMWYVHVPTSYKEYKHVLHSCNNK